MPTISTPGRYASCRYNQPLVGSIWLRCVVPPLIIAAADGFFKRDRGVRMCRILAFLIAGVLLLPAALHPQQQTAPRDSGDTLEIYVIDTEGGQATLFEPTAA